MNTYKLSLTFNGQQLLKANEHDTLQSAMKQARKLVEITTLHDLPCSLSLTRENWIDYLSKQDWQTSNEFCLAADYTDRGNAVLSVIGY